jgi:putative glycosyltransferase (TIGR04372 family)
MNFSRLIRALRLLLLSLFAIPVVIFIRLMRPFKLVRFLNVDFGRIGGVYQLDWYLSKNKSKLNNKKYFDIFIVSSATSHINYQWLKMWRRVIPHLYKATYFWNTVIRINKLIPWYESHLIDDNLVYLRQIDQKLVGNKLKEKKKKVDDKLKLVLKNKQSNLSFTRKEVDKGLKVLKEIGCNGKQGYICFHARDSMFLKNIYDNLNSEYHNYRDSDINNYLLAAQEMASRGIYSIRMGAIVEKKIHCDSNLILDYASSKFRTDFNDVYISSHCKFFLCSDTGLSIVPEVFRLPVVHVNFTNITNISVWTIDSLFVFKFFYLRSENRFMSFSEILDLEFGGPETEETFSKLNIELIENSPEEIRQVTIEMDERLNGTWETREEDKELQERFWLLFGPSKIKSPNLRIGADFLRKNKDLIK